MHLITFREGAFVGTGNKNNNNNRKKKSNKTNVAIKQEAKSWAILITGFLLLVGVFISSEAGFIGNIRYILIGLLGMGAFVLPVALIFVGVTKLWNQRINVSMLNIFLLFWLILAFIHIINPLSSLQLQSEENLRFFRTMQVIYREGYVLGSGILGAVLGMFLQFLFGNFGTSIVLIGAIIVLLVLISGYSLVTLIGKATDHVKELYREHQSHEYETYEEPTLPTIPKFTFCSNVIEENIKEIERHLRISKPLESSNSSEITIMAHEMLPVPSMPVIFGNFPPIDLLTKNENMRMRAESRRDILENSRILEETLNSFRIEAKVTEVSIGPRVTRYELAPGLGVKVSSIAGRSDDLALALAAQGLRIEAPIPGKAAVGIEIPNKEPQDVFLRDIIETLQFKEFPSKLAFALGKDITGAPVITDVATMPHLLIAGATGSGKSVCINTLIASLLYKSHSEEVKLLMIDPKQVELSVYNGIPHLLAPVVTDPKKASGALNWAVQEMEARYNAFAEIGCRDLKGYNSTGKEKLPQIVIIIDELADLMMVAKNDVEDSICRLAQKARASGIHLIVATQRPSVDVVTGLIKANIPSRLVFAVSSGIDSRTVIDMYGAEKLLGKGDMLFLPIGQNKPIRLQGGFISDSEVENIVRFLKSQDNIEIEINSYSRV